MTDSFPLKTNKYIFFTSRLQRRLQEIQGPCLHLWSTGLSSSAPEASYCRLVGTCPAGGLGHFVPPGMHVEKFILGQHREVFRVRGFRARKYSMNIQFIFKLQGQPILYLFIKGIVPHLYSLSPKTIKQQPYPLVSIF